MSENKLVSIIIPVYNVEKFLSRCIDSILNQTYKNLEIILVNDGSPDNSPKMCDDYALTDNRIKVIHKSNGGLSNARNVGFENSTGDYICFVDSDDSVASNYVERLYNQLIKDDCDMVMCNKSFVDENDEDLYEPDAQLDLEEKIFSNRQILRAMSKRKGMGYVSACNKIYKRKLIENLCFPENRCFEDGIYSFFSISNCRKISCVNDKLYHYRMRTGSITKTVTIDMRINEIDSIFYNMELYINKKMFISSMYNMGRVCKRYNSAMNILDKKEFKLKFKKIMRQHIKLLVSSIFTLKYVMNNLY